MRLSFAYAFHAWRAARRAGLGASQILSRESSALLDSRRRERWELVRRQTDGIVTTLYGPRVALDIEDASWMSASIGVSGVLRVAVSELLRALLRPGQTFVDVGANVGYYSVLAASWVSDSGHVVALEPVPKNLVRLRRSVELNHAQNVRTLEVAASDHDGEEELFLDTSSSIGHSLLPSSSRRVVVVPSQRLDSIFAGEKTLGPWPDTIKIHTGSEPQVLRGAAQLLLRRPPHLLFVHHPRVWGEADDVYELLHRAGYRWYEVVDSPRLVRPVRRDQVRERTVELYLEPPLNPKESRG